MARGTSQAGGLTGRTLGHYRLGALLGTGGMAEVYRARDTRLRREVAVKVLPPALAADPSYVTRFRSEARRVAALRHPNIVPVYEFGEQEGLLYLVMPLMQESLRDSLMRSGTLRTGDALAVAIQVASALEAAHAQGIVHRDVKPENILLDRDGRALLTDFGIARELAFLRRQGAVQTLAATGLPVGTPEYMAPEQLRNGPIDQRADVYALGAVLYELLCGVAPHEAGTPYEVAALALTEPITPPSLHNPKVWPALETVILTALASDPVGRYASMADFAVALRGASKRGMGLGLGGGVLRATLPIFRKTAIVDPYEGPTREVLIYGSTGLPTLQVGRARGRRNGNGGGAGTTMVRVSTASHGAGPKGRRLLSIIAALVLAVAVAVAGFYLLRPINLPGTDGGGHGFFSLPAPAATAASSPTTAPSATSDPSATADPSATTAPTATTLPTATAIPQPVIALNPTTWQIHRQSASGSTWCFSTKTYTGTQDTPLTLANNGADAVYWSWGWGAQTPPHYFAWELAPSKTYLSGDPNDANLQAGSTDSLEVKMYCPAAQTSYTITIFELDNVTGQSVSQTITMVVPAAKG